MANQIRNIAQTVQEREIVKTCPDVVVYIEGRPYLVNPYINSKSSQDQSNDLYTIVNFNDYVESFSVAYDVDNLVPSGSFSLNVPAAKKYLFQAPGGANIIGSMMQVQVFAKGYFPAQNGNTLYYRVFKGLVSSVSHTDTGTALQIAVNCVGVLHFLDLMYIDLGPALLTNSPLPAVPMNTNQFMMNPYQALADTFLRAVTPAGFQLNAIQQAALDKGSDWTDAVTAGYINKWQAILTNIMRDVRILGYSLRDSVFNYDAAALNTVFTKPSDDAVGQMAASIRSSRNSQVPKKSVAEQVADQDFYVTIMRRYLPDMQVGQINLLNGKIISRLERIRALVNLISYEGYQDLDGAIIFKPPFYNLDVTNLGTGANSPGTGGSGTPGATSAASYIREDANPFVAYLSEIEDESETEDEAGVRVTRMTIQPDWLPNYHFGAATNILPVAEHIDIAKLSKFGLREQPARQLPFLGSGDDFAMYTYAVSELNRANRGYRTYSFTIPLRPEIRLGFPMYVPHRDMYGYIKTVSISYQQGGAANMRIVLDTVRKRPLLPGYSSITGSDGTQRQVITYTSQGNLVMQWTTGSQSRGSTSNPPSQSSSQTSPGTASGMGGTGTESTDPMVDLKGNPTTIKQPPGTPFYPQEWEYIMQQKEKLGSLYATRFDTTTKSFRIQNDTTTSGDTKVGGSSSPTLVVGKPFFSADNWMPHGIDTFYFKKILTCQPYTDEKGYELITPFPWGRWIDVNTAVRESRLGILSETSNLQGAGTVQAMNVFLFAGLATPTSNDMSSNLDRALNQQFKSTVNGQQASGYDSVEMDSVIELLTPKPGDVGNDTSLTNMSQPDMQNQVSELNTIESRLGVFITGGTSLPNQQTLKGAETTASPNPLPPQEQGEGQQQGAFSIPLEEGTPLAG